MSSARVPVRPCSTSQLLVFRFLPPPPAAARREQPQAHGADRAAEGEGRRAKQRSARQHGLRPQADAVRAQEAVLPVLRRGTSDPNRRWTC